MIFDFNKGKFLFKFFGVGFLLTRVVYWLISFLPSVNQRLIYSFLFNERFLI